VRHGVLLLAITLATFLLPDSGLNDVRQMATDLLAAGRDSSPVLRAGRAEARFGWFAGYNPAAGRPDLARSATARPCARSLLGLQFSALTARCAQ